MKKLEKIKENLLTIIQKEEIKTQSEIEELSQKQRDNMDFYGIGGPYQRYEQAIDRRKSTYPSWKPYGKHKTLRPY